MFGETHLSGLGRWAFCCNTIGPASDAAPALHANASMRLAIRSFLGWASVHREEHQRMCNRTNFGMRTLGRGWGGCPVRTLSRGPPQWVDRGQCSGQEPHRAAQNLLRLAWRGVPITASAAMPCRSIPTSPLPGIIMKGAVKCCVREVDERRPMTKCSCTVKSSLHNA